MRGVSSGLALRFQKDDEVDREVRVGSRRFPWWPFFVIALPWGLIFAIVALVEGVSLADFETQIGALFGVSLLVAFGNKILAPFYREFRFRTKEIDGKVSAIEEAIAASQEQHAELMEQLNLIAKKLESCKECER